MSQLALARPRKASAPRPSAAPLKVVPGRMEGVAGGGFAALCLVLLVAGSLAILLLNTSRAKGAFELRDLQRQSGLLADTQETLQHAISANAAPATLAERARRLGMVPNQHASFLRLPDGAVLGVAQPAVADPTFSVVTSPTPTRAADPKTTAAGPKTTVTKKGTVTTTTVVTTKTGGVVETVSTSVDSKTGRTTTTTTITKPTATKPTKPATPSVQKP